MCPNTTITPPPQAVPLKPRAPRPFIPEVSVPPPPPPQPPPPPCVDNMSFDGGFGNCTTYEPGRLNQGYCVVDEACERCGCTCAEECAGNRTIGSGWGYGSGWYDDSCPSAFNGICEEGTSCAAGTDMSDCRYGDDSCEYANDGTCDEPNLCPAGTDYSDCSNPIWGSGVGEGSGSGADFDSSVVLDLPSGWGDDQVFEWEVGRDRRVRQHFGFHGIHSHEHLSDTDFVVMSRSSTSGANAERKVIHPKKHLNLRFPSLAKGTFRQVTEDTSKYHTAHLQVSVEACDCVTADGCEEYSGHQNCRTLVLQNDCCRGRMKMSCSCLGHVALT